MWFIVIGFHVMGKFSQIFDFASMGLIELWVVLLFLWVLLFMKEKI